jgi:IS1 family transposase
LWKSGKLAVVFELDELYWFIGQKARTSTKENVYLILLISREPRQILSFSVSRDKSAQTIQGIVDAAPDAEAYATDGHTGYLDVIFPGEHIRNVRNKADTHIVESINADLRHFIAGLARRSRCFFRSLETLEAVLSIFVDAYNKFGEAKLKFRKPTIHRPGNESKHLHHWREPAFSILDFL